MQDRRHPARQKLLFPRIQRVEAWVAKGWKHQERREVAWARLMAITNLFFGDMPGQECSPVASQG